MESQEEFDALVAKHGAEAVIKAIQSHSVESKGGGCTPGSCPPHYICNTSSGNCVLDIGKIIA